jgi:hypothetical protein
MYAMIFATSSSVRTYGGIVEGEKPFTSFAVGSTMDSVKKASSATTVEPSANSTFEPKSPNQVGALGSGVLVIE